MKTTKKIEPPTNLARYLSASNTHINSLGKFLCSILINKTTFLVDLATILIFRLSYLEPHHWRVTNQG